MKEGMIEEVSEVEVNDIPGGEYQKPQGIPGFKNHISNAPTCDSFDGSLPKLEI